MQLANRVRRRCRPPIGRLRPSWIAALACLFAALLSASAGAAANELETANDLCDAGRFSEAKLRYERLVDAHDWSANLFYNLANCDYRLGAAGRAILNYERALVLDPGHAEARANLAFLRSKTGAKLREPSWQEAVFSSRLPDVWSVAAAISGWASLFLFAAVVASRGEKRWRLRFGVVASVAGFAFAVAVLSRGVGERKLAIVTAQTAEARLAPTENAGLAETLPAGSRVRVLGERGEWSYCALPGEGRGWILRSAVEKVWLEKT